MLCFVILSIHNFTEVAHILQPLSQMHYFIFNPAGMKYLHFYT